MSYELIQYFNSKFANIYSHEAVKEPLPFVTISRETGCGANIIAEMLQNELRTTNHRWKVVNKEIIDEAASALKIDKQRINDIIHVKNRTMADEILDALSTRYYKNDTTVRKTIAEVVRHDAKKGNIIIVGRGGSAVTQDLPNGLHIKLFAPKEWRINNIIQQRGLSKDAAAAFIKEHDKKRTQLLEQMSEKNIEQILFSLTINRATFTPVQIVKLILEAMKSKEFIN